jgi:hypothetical protein
MGAACEVVDVKQRERAARDLLRAPERITVERRQQRCCFAPRSAEMKLTPVALPPGRLRLVTRPSLTGSPPVAKTIGTVVVTALAASAAGVLPTISATCRRRSSATRSGTLV